MKVRKVKGYRVTEGDSIHLPFDIPDVEHKFFGIKRRQMVIRQGYYYDGASGPVRDTKRTMFAAAFHDVAYQAIREGLIGLEYKSSFDKLFADMCKERGQWEWLVGLYFKGLKKFGTRSCVPGDKPKEYEYH